MTQEEKLEIADGDYAITNREEDKTYTSMEVHAMLAKASIYRWSQLDW